MVQRPATRGPDWLVVVQRKNSLVLAGVLCEQGGSAALAEVVAAADVWVTAADAGVAGTVKAVMIAIAPAIASKVSLVGGINAEALMLAPFLSDTSGRTVPP